VEAWGQGLVVGGAVFGVLALFYLVSRRFERTADAASAELTQDPEAMIAALGRLSRLGLMPTAWSGLTETFTSHPPPLRRVQALALRHGLPFERMRELLKRGLDDGDRYPIPPAAVAETRSFTTAWKQATGTRLGLAVAVAGTAVAVAAGVGVERFGVTGWAAAA